AQRLARRMPRARITFVGGGRDFERRHVAAAGFDYMALPCRAVPKRLQSVPGFLAQNLAGYLAARRFVRDENVSLVVGLGGYASVPVARAAVKAGIKLVLIEQNTVPGRANRWLARSADAVCVAFEQTASKLPRRCATHVTGTPIREKQPAGKLFPEPCTVGASVVDDFAGSSRSLRFDSSHDDFAQSLYERSTAKRLTVLGGSAGAKAINENVPRALYKVRNRLEGWEIVHQTGEAHLESTRVLYRKLGIEASVMPFIADMPELLDKSDLTICRAGGSTLAEVAAAGSPAVILPYPHAAADHQRKNAELFSQSGGCVLLDERETHDRLDDRLAESLDGLLGDDARRQRISQTVRRLGRPKAAETIADIVEGML
ncbi:MAG: UDP-N-acetylglucosamine--N-acetylmuramyl-(pentapeptide) pyrophosphoryl-undecaprenol N-acetylglucosamine transferase, partial [Pirellulales bacterium]|nr:UDP-N-acetylglucosamine--N-acetylmuramyl-(pentapeptide) pyrophosphoryl-undecaprenol N-acetylglucosamine transferase [Pirellulales bacterium]